MKSKKGLELGSDAICVAIQKTYDLETDNTSALITFQHTFGTVQFFYGPTQVKNLGLPELGQEFTLTLTEKEE